MAFYYSNDIVHVFERIQVPIWLSDNHETLVLRLLLKLIACYSACCLGTSRPLFIWSNISLLLPLVTRIFSVFTDKWLLFRFCGTCFFHCLFERQINLVYKHGSSKGVLSSAIKNSDDGVLEGLWTDTLAIVHCLTFVYNTNSETWSISVFSCKKVARA